MGEVCVLETDACFPTFGEAIASRPSGGTLAVGEGDYFEELVFSANFTIVRSSESTLPTLLHSPGAGAPIVEVSGPGVRVQFVGIDFDGSDGRVFEVSDGARLSLGYSLVTSTAIRTYGAVGIAENAELDLDYVEIIGGSGTVGGQLWLEDSSLSAFGASLIEGRGLNGGVIELVDTDGVPEQHGLVAFSVRDADVPFAAAAMTVRGDDVACSLCEFENTSSGIRVEGGSLELSESGMFGLSRHGVEVRGSLELGITGIARVLDSEFADVGYNGLLATEIDTVEVRSSSFSRVGQPLQLNRVADIDVVGNLLCGFGNQDNAYAVGLSHNGGEARFANNRFVGGVGQATFWIADSGATVGRIEVVHNDFVGNDTGFVFRGGASPAGGTRDTFVDNLIAGQRGAVALVHSPALASAATNLVSDADGAPWSEDGASYGFEGFPGWLSFDTSDACGMADSWEHDPAGPWPSWRYEGRDAGSFDLDPDGTPSDIGAVGGAEAAILGFWLDQDEDGWPEVYDCDDVSALQNPDKVDLAYDGVDEDCDGYSDYDQDLDGFDSDAYGGEDCDDLDALVHPGAYDEPNDDADGDCDDDRDADGDGYAYPEDCDDTEFLVNPASVEDPGGLDRDCDGRTDAPTRLRVPCSTAPGGAWAWVLAVFALRRRR